jgi:hypothetical protein
MNWSLRRFAPLGAVVLALAFLVAAVMLVSAQVGSHHVGSYHVGSYQVGSHDGSQLAQEICVGTASAATVEAPFLAENDAAMRKMMNGMAVESTGDVDADFVAMMVPHHQGAIEMAVAVLRYGRNAQIRRLAQEIIVTQQEEIAAMRLAVGQPLPASVASPTEVPPAAQFNSKSRTSTHQMMEP